MANLDGVNYAQARAADGHEVADAIFQALHRERHDRACITRRRTSGWWEGTGVRA